MPENGLSAVDEFNRKNKAVQQEKDRWTKKLPIHLADFHRADLLIFSPDAISVNVCERDHEQSTKNSESNRLELLLIYV